MDEFEKQWAAGALSGSPGTVISKEAARFNWRQCLLFVRSRMFEHEDALDVIEEELGE